RQRGRAVGRLDDVVPLRAQDVAQEPALGRVVLDDQDGRVHCATACVAAGTWGSSIDRFFWMYRPTVLTSFSLRIGFVRYAARPALMRSSWPPALACAVSAITGLL